MGRLKRSMSRRWCGDVTVRDLGDPTALIDIGGVRMITDPMFDLPGEWLLPIRHAAGSQDRQN